MRLSFEYLDILHDSTRAAVRVRDMHAREPVADVSRLFGSMEDEDNADRDYMVSSIAFYLLEGWRMFNTDYLYFAGEIVGGGYVSLTRPCSREYDPRFSVHCAWNSAGHSGAYHVHLR
jgi:hypothetical protein